MLGTLATEVTLLPMEDATSLPRSREQGGTAWSLFEHPLSRRHPTDRSDARLPLMTSLNRNAPSRTRGPQLRCAVELRIVREVVLVTENAGNWVLASPFAEGESDGESPDRTGRSAVGVVQSCDG